MDLEQLAKSFPAGNGGATLQIAAWHLQTVLTAISNSDSKIMLLTALNAAGLSALVGIAITSSPAVWLLGLGLTLSGLCVVIGLGRLWAVDVPQFPDPDEAWGTAQLVGESTDWLQWQLFLAVREAVLLADVSLRRSTLVLRSMLSLTPISLALLVVVALTVID